jgi:membrane protein required for colicin V production
MIIDLLFLASAIYGLYIGFTRGIIKTVFTVLSVVFGLIIAFRFSPDVTEFLATALASDNALMFIAGFILTFVISMVIIRTFARALESGFRSANINVLNQAAGAVVTAAITTLVFSTLLWFGDQAHLIKEESKRESMSYSFLERYPQSVWKIAGKLKPTLVKFWGKSMEFFDKIEGQRIERTESEPNIYDLDE